MKIENCFDLIKNCINLVIETCKKTNESISNNKIRYYVDMEEYEIDKDIILTVEFIDKKKEK